MRYTPKERQAAIDRAMSCGLTYAHAVAVRRIALTLHRWYELECGYGNDHGEWAIERGDNGDGPPEMVHHHYLHGKGKDYTTRYRIPDRETGAIKRLDAIMAHYPDLRAYLQTDPRGGTLYVIRPGDVPEGKEVGAYYNRGVFVA